MINIFMISIAVMAGFFAVYLIDTRKNPETNAYESYLARINRDARRRAELAQSAEKLARKPNP